ncbi:LptA/OstA family protein [Gimesia maris]|uniref:LptA/OstA family protein n=1 Tax=Gimesia maris TaxID=122 RepID=UPI00241CDCF5|nr:LptA/OstA family protein [Gimesia maris]|tara:strand:+ start:115821 stop:118964 length:3144 start_codon:yes stop_codon:yes gene_type:complete
MTGTIRPDRNGFFDRLIANRLLLTWFTTAALSGAYLVYAQAMRTVIKEQVIRQEFPEEVFTSPAYASGNNEKAKTFLPEHDWAADARYQFKDENVYVYTEQWEQEEDDKAARLKPFAMLMFDRKKGETEAPIALVSEEALVRFEYPFGIKHTDPGRMVAGSLEGRVKITGPNGLIIWGKNFWYDEASMNIYSDHEVQFAYEDHRGQARGIEMKLIPAAAKPKELKPAVEGIREIVLRHNVHMKLAIKKNPEPSETGPSRFATVKSGSFTFNLETNQGTFKDDVRVYHPTSPQHADTLQCDTLELQFVRKDETGNTISDATPQTGHSSGKLTFEELIATGSTVTLISEENQFTGTMTRLLYNEATKTIVMQDQQAVRIFQQSSELQCPEITINQDQEGRLQTVFCKGVGFIKHRDPASGQLLMAAQWVEHMKKSTDPESGLEMVELEKDCIVRKPDAEFALAAHKIRLWLKGELPSVKQSQKVKLPGSQPDSKDSQEMQHKIDPHKMIAEQDVAIYSPQLRGKTRRLEVWFDEETKPQSAPNAPIGVMAPRSLSPVKHAAFAVEDSLPAQQQQAAGSPTGRVKIAQNGNTRIPAKQDATAEPIMVVAELMKIRLRKNDLGKEEVTEVWTEGNVTVDQFNEKQDQPLHITGNQLHIQNKGSNDQILHVIGSPAKINAQGSQIEGEHIYLYRLANRAEVQGKGLLLLPVRGGQKAAGGLLSGAEGITKENRLASTMTSDADAQDNLLEIHWDQEMIFDGLTANFFGKVRTNLGDNRLRCQEMEVILSDRVSFTEKNPSDQKPDVHFITCRDGVEVESNEYLDNRLVGIRRASFWQMNVDQKTGNAEARGPGWLVLWRRENPEKTTSESKVSQANLPQKTESDSWNYTRIDFNGKMAGNVSQRSTTFDDRVQITYGGVKRPLDTIDPDRMPPGAGSMRSNSLKLIQHDIDGQKKKFISMLAKGNAEVEGNTLIKNKQTPTSQEFSASADTISFDESKDQYTLRSFGNRKATLRRFSPFRQSPTRSVSQQIEFSPSHDRVTLHGVTEIQGLP